ncbi:MAG: hypothetical protein IJ744_06325 [Lachnospiraceae bacterium]|nr:hypothetical protein [Lachnospiraceae bacterium]
MKKGSFTVEASLVLPIFLAAILTVVSFLPVIKNQEEILVSMLETGKWASEVDFFYERWGEESDLAEGIVLQEKMRAGLSEEGLFERGIVLGRAGFFGWDSRVSETIWLKAFHFPTLAVRLAPVSFQAASQQAQTRGFIGDDTFPGTPGNTGHEHADGEEDYVYVTDYGVVYHRTLACPHLNLTILAGSLSSIDGARNDSGGKYYPCEFCHPGTAGGGVYYYTTDGDRYHADYHCQALTRTIREVPLSQVSLPPCSTCGW